MRKQLRQMTKIDKAVSDCELLSNPKYGTLETYREAIYRLGEIAFIKALQGKLYEIKYDGTVSKIGKELEQLK